MTFTEYEPIVDEVNVQIEVPVVLVEESVTELHAAESADVVEPPAVTAVAKVILPEKPPVPATARLSVLDLWKTVKAELAEVGVRVKSGPETTTE
jgi:hypothetical protein